MKILRAVLICANEGLGFEYAKVLNEVGIYHVHIHNTTPSNDYSIALKSFQKKQIGLLFYSGFTGSLEDRLLLKQCTQFYRPRLVVLTAAFSQQMSYLIYNWAASSAIPLFKIIGSPFEISYLSKVVQYAISGD